MQKYKAEFERVEFKLVEGDNIYHKVIDSIVRNNGDKIEAERLFSEYLNNRYALRYINGTLKMEIEMEVDRMNDYIRNNYSAISQFGKPVKCYYFKVTYPTVRLE